MNKTAKLSYQNCGTFWRIIVSGDTEEAITQKYWSLFNWQATDIDEFNWETDFSGWVWCKPKKLLRALTNAHLFKLIDEAEEKGETNKGLKGGLMPQAKLNAQLEFQSMESIPDYVKYGQVRDILNMDITYSMGTIKAEKLDKDS